MAFSGLFPFCGTLVMALLTYGKASRSDEDTVGNVNEESNNRQEAVKDLKEAFSFHKVRGEIDKIGGKNRPSLTRAENKYEHYQQTSSAKRVEPHFYRI